MNPCVLKFLSIYDQGCTHRYKYIYITLKIYPPSKNGFVNTMDGKYLFHCFTGIIKNLITIVS